MSLRKTLVKELEKLGVEDRPLAGRDDGFSSLCYQGKEFAHFHNDHELDIRLTKRLIEREGLTHPPNSTRHPNRKKPSHWIELRYSTAEDLERVIQLVRMTVETMSSTPRARR